MNTIRIPENMKIQLTPVESQLCDLLKKFTVHLQETQSVSTTCRIAGGWVRDKLLDLDSNDIDIALSNMMGLPFADAFKDFAKNEGIDSSKVAVIKKNPEQSKHLEPATLRILGLDIDFVNLRSEEYTTESRIPSAVKFGTPLEDALRRDTTMNSLFYNVHDGLVEDFTGKGLTDLKSGIIRTPLPPRETFDDDPLRVLRCIRFAGRYGFELDKDIRDAAADAKIQAALVAKVRRDRVGEEISKMMKGRDPFGSLQLIHELSLYPTVFFFLPLEVTSTLSEPLPSSTAALASASILQLLLHPKPTLHLSPLHPLLLKAIQSDASCTGRLFLATSLSPLLGITYKDHKGKSFPVLIASLRDSLRLGQQYHFLDGIPALFAAYELLRNPSRERFQSPSERVAIGTLLRNKLVHNGLTGSHWTSSLLFSLVQELLPYYDAVKHDMEVDGANQIIETYNSFVKRVDELGLTQISETKTLLDGRDVTKVLNATPGPWTGQVLARVMEWQLDHPQGSKEDCIEWLKHAHATGEVVIESTSSEPAAKRIKTK